MNSDNFIRTPQPDGAELAAKLVSLFSFSLLSVLFGIKTFNIHFKYLSYSRWLVLALYILSWSFTCISMVLVTTNNGNFVSCFLSIMVCDIFYSGTKIVIYAWLIEKIYVVSSARLSRWKTASYRFHMCLLVPYIAIFILMILFHVAELEDNGTCIIGLQSPAAIPLVTYDFLINMYMTFFFIKPLIKSGDGFSLKISASRLHSVARRTLIASLVCLVASFVNILSLQLFHGRERGLVCLTCCTVDVTVNVITIHWVTSHAPNKRMKEDGTYNSAHQHHSSNESSNRHLSRDDEETVSVCQPSKPYGYTEFDFPADDLKSTSPYKANVVVNHHHPEKCDDQLSSTSIGCNSSIIESQSSRKSLTQK
ncbi:hypothetical protein K501DRAFT_235918 [Backusella circina FSU 941]|nr:hypothetical protein K501DRAFT_235918 [Backusella circina FSU 941]